MIGIDQLDQQSFEDLESKIEIFKENGVISQLNVAMPTWIHTDEDGNLNLSMPLIGMEVQIANTDDDVEKAANEAISIFCLAAEKYGKGIEKEIEELGWELHQNITESSNANKAIVFDFEPTMPVYAQMIQTGNAMALSTRI